MISLSTLDSSKTIWKNEEASIQDIGDGIINVTFHSKMNTIGGGILSAINTAIDFAEEGLFKGIIISDDLSMKSLKGSIKENTIKTFSAGCNLSLH